MTIASSAPLARTASPLSVLEVARETYRRQPMLASVGLLMLIMALVLLLQRPSRQAVGISRPT